MDEYFLSGPYLVYQYTPYKLCKKCYILLPPDHGTHLTIYSFYPKKANLNMDGTLPRTTCPNSLFYVSSMLRLVF